MLYIFFLIYMAVYWVFPLPVQIILLIADAFVPDMIPVVDELLMAMVVINRVKKYIAIGNFIRTHKILTAVIMIAIVVGAVTCIQWLLSII